jgi:thymidine kinase
MNIGVQERIKPMRSGKVSIMINPVNQQNQKMNNTKSIENQHDTRLEKKKHTGISISKS